MSVSCDAFAVFIQSPQRRCGVDDTECTKPESFRTPKISKIFRDTWVTLRFDVFTFDSRSGQLRRDNHTIPLPGNASEVLSALLERRPEMVSKEKLLQRVWHGTAVTEASLSVAIAKL